MSQAMICDLIFNMSEEFSVLDVVRVATENYGVAIGEAEVISAIHYLIAIGEMER